MVAVGRAKSDEEKASAVGRLATALGLLEEAFEKLSQGKTFFGGDEIGYIDIALGSCLMWLKVIEKRSDYTFMDETKTPGLNQWAERFCSHAAVKELMPETDKLLEFGLRTGRIAAPPK